MSDSRRKIFLSYSSANRDRAAALQRALERVGRGLFRRSRGIVFRYDTDGKADESLKGELIKEIDKADGFVLLASKDAAKSEWVEWETQTWINRKGRSP